MTTTLLGDRTSTWVLVKTYGPEYNRTCVDCLDKRVSCFVEGNLTHEKNDGSSPVVAASVGYDTARSIGLTNIIRSLISAEALARGESKNKSTTPWQVTGTSTLSDSITYDVPMNTYWMNKWEAEKIEADYHKIEYEYWEANIKQDKESEWQAASGRRGEEDSHARGINYKNLRKVKGYPKNGPA